MKRNISLLLAMVMLAGTLAGCAGGSGQPTETSYVDVYKSTFSSSITTLNPYDIEYASDYAFSGNFMDSLLETDKYGRLAPSLAESWDHNEDYTVWTFKLRPDMYWVDSRGQKTEYEVDAEDFVSGVRYIADPAHSVTGLSTVRNVLLGLYDFYYDLVDIDEGVRTDVTREAMLATFDQAVGVKALDKYTVEYTMEEPCAYFDALCDLNMLLPVEQAFLDQVGEEYGTAMDKLLYCGAYYISRWDRDKMVEMTKNPHYWDADRVTVSTLSWEYVSDNISTLELFKRGDVTDVSLSSEDVASIRGTEWEDKVYLSEKTPTTYWFSFNFTTENPEMAAAVLNENFRKAIFSAIDAVTISAVYEPSNPEFFTRYTLLPEESMYDDNGVDYTDYPALAPYKGVSPFDKDKARSYMEAAAAELTEADGVTLKGVTPGKVDMLPITEFSVDGKLPVQLVYSGASSESEMKIAALMKEMLETYIGKEYVEVILGYSSNSFSSEVYDLGNWDLLQDSYSFRYADPSSQIDRCTSDYDITDSGYNIPEFDAMAEVAGKTYETSARFTAYSEAEAWLLEHAYILPFMTGGGAYKMTYVVPYTTPGGKMGRSRYKMKGALIQSTAITAEQYNSLTEQLKQEVKDLSK